MKTGFKGQAFGNDTIYLHIYILGKLQKCGLVTNVIYTTSQNFGISTILLYFKRS